MEAGIARAAMHAVGVENEYVVEAGLGVLVEVTAYEEGVGSVKELEAWDAKLGRVGKWLGDLSGEDAEAAREQAVSLKVLR